MRWFFFLIFIFPIKVQAFTFLTGYDEAPSVAAALERIKGQPDKHVLVYFDMSEFCPPCREQRALLNSDSVRAKWRPNYVVVNIDLFAPTKEEREVIEQVRVSWAPVLVFLNASGKRVAYSRQLFSERDAMEMNAFVSQRQYATSTLGKYSQNLDTGSVRALAAAEPRRIDDRLRLRDVTARPHERIQGDELRRLLTGKRMRKESQDWFLKLEFTERNKILEVSGSRKNGRGEMTGTGKWYVTRKGKLCVDVFMRDVDERWCRHVFRAGETYYLSKDLRPDRVVYRMVPDGG